MFNIQCTMFINFMTETRKLHKCFTLFYGLNTIIKSVATLISCKRRNEVKQIHFHYTKIAHVSNIYILCTEIETINILEHEQSWPEEGKE